MPKNVVIVGGGVVGLSCAYYCALRGHSVTVVERESPGHRPCSWGNSGMVVPSHFEPFAAPGMIETGLKMMLNPESPFSFSAWPSRALIGWTWRFWEASNHGHVKRCSPVLAAMHLASRLCFEELQTILEFELEKSGMYMLCATQKGLEEEARLAERARRFGVRAVVLCQEDLNDRQPHLQTSVSGAVHYEDDCHLTPGDFLDALTKQLDDLGVQRVQGEVEGFVSERNSLFAVATREREIEGDSFVIAAGAWTSRLAGKVGIDVPIVAGKGFSMTLTNPPEKPSAGMLLKEARVAVTPMSGGLRFGGTMQISDLDLSINEAKVRGIKKSVGKYFPAFSEKDFAGAEVWCGLRPVSADGMPFIGPTKRYSNMQIAAGHGMMGLSLGPITGKLIAQAISGESPDIESPLLDPDRYA